MKPFVFALTLTFAAALIAQQQPSQAYPPPGQSQQTMPNQQAPPDQQSPATLPDSTATAQVQEQIQQSWQSQSDLSKDKLNAQVSGGTVTIEGTVGSEAEHQKAVQVATQNAGGMKVVDHIKVQPQ